MLTAIQAEKIKIKLIRKNMKQKDLVEKLNIPHKAVLSMILNCKYTNREIESKLVNWLNKRK